MILPTDIVTQHKIRDSKICSLYTRGSATLEEIALRFKISATRVSQILYKNKHLVKIDKEYEKLKRLAVLKRLLNKHPETMGKKDTLDIVSEMRAETEGRQGSEGGSREVTINIIRAENDSRPEVTTISRQIPI